MADSFTAFTAPMVLHHGQIEVQGTLNGKPADLILDTGATATAVSPDAARRWGLVADQATVEASGVAGTVTIHSGGDVTIGIGSALLEHEPAFIVPLPEMMHHCDAILGYSFFQRFGVVVDYQNRRCGFGPDTMSALAAVTAASPVSNAAKKDDEVLTLPLTLPNGVPVIHGGIDGQPVGLRIDSGDGGMVTVYQHYVEEHHLLAQFSHAQATGASGLGGEAHGDLVRLPSFALGTSEKPTEMLTLRDVVATLSAQTVGAFTTRDADGQIGGQILRRFVVTFDYANSRLLLRPNGTFGEPFVYNRAGFGVDERDGKYIARFVLRQGPADVAGMQDGDAIDSIDGIPIGQLMDADDDTYGLTKKPVGTVLHILYRRGTQPPALADVTLRETI